MKSVVLAALVYFLISAIVRASAFSICVLHFTEELKEFWAYPLLLKDFIPRLTQCSSPDLNHLMEIPGVKIGRAKQLLNANFKKIVDVAQAKPRQLTEVIQFLTKTKAANMIEAAKMILKSKVEALEEEAVEMKESNRMIVKEDAEGDKDYDNAEGEKGNLDAVVDVAAEITDV